MTPLFSPDHQIGVLGFRGAEIGFDILSFNFQRRKVTGVSFDSRLQAVERTLTPLIRKLLAVAVDGANRVSAIRGRRENIGEVEIRLGLRRLRRCTRRLASKYSQETTNPEKELPHKIS
jgi:hypothetical protein